MSVEELKKINEDEEDLEKFVNNLPHVQSLKQTVVDLINGTEELESTLIFFSIRGKSRY